MRAQAGAATLADADVDRMAAYLQQIGREESAAPQDADTGTGVPMISNWTLHGATTDTSATINLQAGVRDESRLEYYENTGSTAMRLRWQTPGTSSCVAILAHRLFTN